MRLGRSFPSESSRKPRMASSSKYAGRTPRRSASGSPSSVAERVASTRPRSAGRGPRSPRCRDAPPPARSAPSSRGTPRHRGRLAPNYQPYTRRGPSGRTMYDTECSSPWARAFRRSVSSAARESSSSPAHSSSSAWIQPGRPSIGRHPNSLSRESARSIVENAIPRPRADSWRATSASALASTPVHRASPPAPARGAHELRLLQRCLI